MPKRKRKAPAPPRFQPIIIEGVDPWTNKVEQSRRAESAYAAKVIRQSLRNAGWQVRERNA